MTQVFGTKHAFRQGRVGHLDKTSCFLLIATFCKNLGTEIIHSRLNYPYLQGSIKEMAIIPSVNYRKMFFIRGGGTKRETKLSY